MEQRLLSNEVRQFLDDSKNCAKEFGHNYISIGHGLLTIIRKTDSVAADFLIRHGLDEEWTLLVLRALYPTLRRKPKRPPLDPRFIQILNKAMDEMNRLEETQITIEHWLLALLAMRGKFTNKNSKVPGIDFHPEIDPLAVFGLNARGLYSDLLVAVKEQKSLLEGLEKS